jgi:N-acetylmuramoyl-L-alanine amidase
MRFLFRPAALAAAALSFGAAAASFATEAETAPTGGYTDHIAAAALVSAELGDLGLNGTDQPAQLAHDVDFTNDVAAHAVAPAAPAAPARVETAQRVEADEDAERDGRSLSQLVRDLAAVETADEETECLARAVYYESKGEPLAGQLSVAEVIINRARSGRFPSTICGVVRQPSQFSFVRRGHIPQPPANAQWRTAVAIARIAQQDLADGAAPRALFFHARRVSPGWRNLTRVATVGNHVFYR